MSTVTYYARIGYENAAENQDNISVTFPDLRYALASANTREEAIELAKEALAIGLDWDENDKIDLYPPSTLEELEAEARADGSEWDYLREDEISYEFVPITIPVPENKTYLKKMRTDSRLGNNGQTLTAAEYLPATVAQTA